MTRRKDGLWTQSVTINGKRKYFYGKTKQEVLRKINQYKRRNASALSFREVVSQWQDEYLPTVSTGTQYQARTRCMRLLDAFGDTNIGDITSPQLDDFVTTVAQTMTVNTVRSIISTCSMIFSFAARKGYIVDNPAAALKARGKPNGKRTPPTSDTIAKVKASAHLPMGLFAIWCMYTGCRRGELLALSWDDVDLDNRVIHINKTLYFTSSVTEIHPPKTAAGNRLVPILDALLPYIPQERAGLIFPDTHDNTAYMGYTHFCVAWTHYLKAMNFSERVTPHAFRHLYATMLYEQGIPPEQAQILLGHASLAMTMDLYREIRRKMQLDVGHKILSADIE